jgi:hypothetical protein
MPTMRTSEGVLDIAKEQYTDVCCLVARIAHLASDVIVSVVPSLATDSEFSVPLQALQKDNAPSIVCKTQPEVSTDHSIALEELVVTFSLGPHSTPKCGSAPLGLPA